MSGTKTPKPFVWHKTAEQILERLAGYSAAINQGNYVDPGTPPRLEGPFGAARA